MISATYQQPPVYQKYFGLGAAPFEPHQPRFSSASFFNRNISMCSNADDTPEHQPYYLPPAAQSSTILDNIFAQTNSRHRISMDFSNFFTKPPPK